MEWEGLIRETAARRRGILPTQKKQLCADSEFNISTSIDFWDTYVVHGSI